MIVLNCEQGSDEWFEARCGVATASKFDAIITTTGKASTQAEAYMNSLVAEYFTREKVSIKQNEWMQRGVELEVEARAYYELTTGREVSQVGFILKDDQKLIGCSPDGLMLDRGLEIKCPAPSTHISYLLSGKLPTAYFQQVQGSMWVTGFDKWDFLSYCPNLPPLLLTIEKDAVFHDQLSQAMSDFIEKMQEKKRFLINKYTELTIK